MSDLGSSRATSVDATVLGGRYALVRRLAVGGMGTVWVATDRVLGRHVAVKILRDDLVDSGVFLERFRNEARHTASLAHPGVAGVFDYGEDRQDGHLRAYLVMELVKGRPLSTLLAEDGPLCVRSALSVLAQSADALQAAHEIGVIHRDVKPGNILMLEDGSIKLTDFGIARAIEGVSITEIGTVIGTAQYMSPEQASGGSLTPASDIYSLGVVGYEMLVGRPPFEASTPGALALAHVQRIPPPLPLGIPAAVSALVMRALSKDPATRPADAQAFALEARRLQTQVADGVPTELLVDQWGTATTVIDEFDTGVPTIPVGSGVSMDGGQQVLVAPAARTNRRRPALSIVASVAVAMIAALVFVVARSRSDRQLPVIVTSPVAESVVSSTPTTITTAVSPPSVAPATVAPPPVTTTVASGNGNGKGHGKGKPKG